MKLHLFAAVAAALLCAAPIVSADAAAALDQGIDIDDIEEHGVDVEPAVSLNLESNSAARLARRLDPKRTRVREGKGGKITKSEKPDPDGSNVCGESCMVYLVKGLKQLKDLVEPENLEEASEMLTEAAKSIGESYTFGYEEESKEDAIQNLNPCDSTLLSLTTSVIAVILALFGLPSRLTTAVASRIIGRLFTREFTSFLRDIALNYLTSSNILTVAEGIVQVINFIFRFFTPGELFEMIIDELTWWDKAAFGTLVLAQIVATFVTAGAALAVRIATMGPPIVEVVQNAVAVANNC